ncbi:hypothetical protein FJY94_03685 [Candidatus Kaiserbacteria bacterium]|nr:hypothetical protein [Candidatus Kaiserbacteria bacterium]
MKSTRAGVFIVISAALLAGCNSGGMSPATGALVGGAGGAAIGAGLSQGAVGGTLVGAAIGTMAGVMAGSAGGSPYAGATGEALLSRVPVPAPASVEPFAVQI